jgi:tRNA pseudouridine38-40 synthase
MPNWKLNLAYDGTGFHGWQVQPALPTVQGALAQAIRHVTRETVLPQGSGRTDAGVHALGQVASFPLNASIPPANLLRALNRALPPAIRVMSAEIVPDGFHARHSALRKTYEYRIFPRVPEARTEPDRICPPTLAPYAWDCPWHIDLDLARQASAHVLGTHDFTSFAATDPDVTTRTTTEAEADPVPRTAVRTIHASIASRAPASCTTWCATWPARSSRQPPAAPIRMPSRKSWQQRTELLPVKQFPPAVCSSCP